MSIKKSVMSASALVLAVTAISGTYALTQGEDEKVNVATYGQGVDIQIIEQQRSNGENSDLESFEQGKMLYPIVGEAQGTKDKWGMPIADNFVDKIVTVQNTGIDDAYVRFFFAVPSAAINGTANDIIHTSWGNRFDPTGSSTYNEGETWKTEWGWDYSTADQTCEIDGVNYTITTFVYKSALKSGETTDAAIAGLYMDSRIEFENGVYTFDGEAINYDFSQQYVLPVYAQAVSTSLGDTAEEAFVKAGMSNNPWSDGEIEIPVLVDTVEELGSALANGGTAALTSDISTDAYLNIADDVEATINLNGNTFTRSTDGGTGIYVNNDDAVLNIVGEGSVVAEHQIYNNAGTVNIYGGTYADGTHAVYVQGTGKVNIYGGTFSSKDNDFVLNQYDSDRATSSITVYGGTFINWNPANNASEGAGTNFVASGYTVTSETKANGDVWYTVVAE